MMSFITMFRKENLELIRSKKVLILIIVFVFVAISSPILAKLTPELLKAVNTSGITITFPAPTWRDAIDQLAKNATQLAVIVIIFMFAGTVAEEKNKKSLEILLTKPISRTNFILAKFFSSAFYMTLIFIVGQIIFYFYTVSLLESFSFINFAWLSLFILVFLLTVFALTLFFSTITKSLVVAALLTFVFTLVSTLVIGFIKAIKNYSPSFINSNYKDLMATGDYHKFLPSLFSSLIIIVALIILAILFFSKQEVER